MTLANLAPDAMANGPAMACSFDHGPARERLPVIDFFCPRFKTYPHRAYATLRRDAPVHQMPGPDGRPIWLVTRHADVLTVLRDPRFVKDRLRFQSAEQRAAAPKLPAAMRYLTAHLLAVDPPRHSRLRRRILQAFAPRLVESLQPRIQAIADALLDRALREGRIELINDYALLLPITVIAELLGVPVQDHAVFRSWSEVVITNVGRLDAQAVSQVAPVLESLAAYMHTLFEHKRRMPGADLTSQLVGPDADGEVLNEDELIAMMLLLIVAGHETTAHLIGNGMLALLQHPAQMDRLRRDRALLPQAIEELLRYDGPIETSTLRYADVDFSFSGQRLKRGDVVMAVLSSANRDAARHADADSLDIDRQPMGHLAFGHGIHFCIGAALARLEGRIAIGTLLQRTLRLRLAVDPRTLRWRLGPLTRGLVALPLVFDVLASTERGCVP
jgi:cytochrome P450